MLPVNLLVHQQCSDVNAPALYPNGIFFVEDVLTVVNAGKKQRQTQLSTSHLADHQKLGRIDVLQYLLMQIKI